MAKYIVGIDEAGRGPIAGPITVGVALIPQNFKILNVDKLRDSKKLTQKRREDWFAYIKKHPKIFFASASVSAKIIDKIGIQKATGRALARALNSLIRKSDLRIWKPGFQMNKIRIMLDGLLHAPKKYTNQKTIIKGDEKIPVISLASIVAKVTRDKKMTQFSKKYPKYSFETHKGYGTREHYRAVSRYGVCEIHRKTYLY